MFSIVILHIFLDGVNKKICDGTYQICDYIPIAIGFSFIVNYESCFGLGCINN